MLDRAIPNINPNHVSHQPKQVEQTLNARVQRAASPLVVLLGVQINSDPYGNGSVLISTRLRYRDLTPGSLRKVLPHYPYLTAALPPDRSRVVQVRSITMMGNGTFGWVQGFDRQLPATPERFGRFFIDGLHLPQGGTWVGRIYPTDRTVMRFGLEYPCYTVRRKVFPR